MPILAYRPATATFPKSSALRRQDRFAFTENGFLADKFPHCVIETHMARS